MTKREKLKAWIMTMMRFVVLKVSGEWLGRQDSFDKIAAVLQALLALGVQIGIVVGGGSLCRGVTFAKKGHNRSKVDRLGMKATEFIGMQLCEELALLGIKAVVLSATKTAGIDEVYAPELAKQYMQQGIVPIMVGGIDVPYTNTDVKSALVAAELKATLLMGKNNTDKVYNKDPNKHKDDPDLVGYDEMVYDQIIRGRLDIMPVFAADILEQANAVTMVFNVDKANVLEEMVMGERPGTIITAKSLIFDDDPAEVTEAVMA